MKNLGVLNIATVGCSSLMSDNDNKTIYEIVGRDKARLVQLAKNLNSINNPEGTIKFPCYLSEKLDGVFCFAVKHDGTVTIYSRTGEVYSSMKHIENELDTFMHEGEVAIFEAYNENFKQSVLSGWCRDTKEQHTELLAFIHTFLTLDEFKGTASARTFTQQRADFLERFSPFEDDMKYVGCIYHSCCDNLEQALKAAKVVWSMGGEGVILRNPDATYKGGKRNKDIIKIKQGVSYDLEVVDIDEGKGKYAGTLGTLICKWKDNQFIRISGMTDSQRKAWWKDPALIIGRVVQVDAMCESSKGKLREPRFKGIRTDKIEGDF